MNTSSIERGLRNHHVLPGQVIRERAPQHDRNATGRAPAPREAFSTFEIETDEELPFTD